MKMETMVDAYITGTVSGVMIFLALVALIIVGSMTSEDLTDEQNLYCKNVYEETHPDYKNIFAKSCAEWLTEHDKSVN